MSFSHNVSPCLAMNRPGGTRVSSFSTRIMKVCLVHNHYGVRAGEEVAVEAIQRVLAANGHDVTRFSRHTDDLLRKRLGKLRAFASGIWNTGVARDFADMLSLTEPDIVQVQNVYPAISPAIFDVARLFGIPLVMRCSNYRLFCPTGLLMSKKTCEVCERCVAGREYWCALKNCEASFGKSVGYALRTAYHRIRGTMTKNASAYYCPSAFLKQKLVAWGMPEEKIAVIPTPVQDMACPPRSASSGEYVAYAGRVSPEKGVDWLLSVAAKLKTVPFRIAGQISSHCSHMMTRLPTNVTYIGELAGTELDDFYNSARIVVVPSICYEVFPNVALEAMIRARPVVGSRIGGIPEIVEDENTGLLVTPRNVDELSERLAALWVDGDACDRIGNAGRIKARKDHSENRFYARLMSLYARVVEHRNALRPGTSCTVYS